MLGSNFAVAVAFAAACVAISLRKRERRRRLRSPLFLGFDFSTQSFTTVVVDDSKGSQEIVHLSQVSYDEAFPEFGTENGIIRDPENAKRICAPSKMFFQALDKAFEDIPREIRQRIVAISGSAQQHGSVYWNENAENLDLDQELSLAENIQRLLALENGPIWMDSSTSSYCEALCRTLGPAKVALISGSRPYERFTANQMAKILKESPISQFIYRASLLSSALASALVGRLVPSDWADASGMNIFDITTCEWSRDLIEAYSALSNVTAAQLEVLIGPSPVFSWTFLGNLDSYFSERYSLSRNCEVYAFSGDNPNTIAGLRLESNDVAVSLGTSTTVLGLNTHPKPSAEEGHVMRSPLSEAEFMLMACFKNGGLPRAQLCSKFAGSDWTKFEELIDVDTIDCLTFDFPETEIAPRLRVPGRLSFKNGWRTEFSRFTPSQAVTSVILAQCLAMRVHAEKLGLTFSGRVLVTGGGSQSQKVLQIIADVFQSRVFVVDSITNTAALGAAFRAKHSYIKRRMPSCTFKEAVGEATIQLRAEPRLGMKLSFERALVSFRDLERQVISELG